MTTTVAPTAAAPAPSGKTTGGSGKPKAAKLVRMLPLSPAIGLMLVFLAGPILYCLYAAFTNMALTARSSSVSSRCPSRRSRDPGAPSSSSA